MKTCTTCHLVYEDRFIFCTRDGTVLNSSITSKDASERKSIRQSGIETGHSEAAGLRVMYCPACAMEYPLTFTSCPSDSMPLREKKPRPVTAIVQSSPIVYEKPEVPCEPVPEAPELIHQPVEIEEVKSAESEPAIKESFLSDEETVHSTDENIYLEEGEHLNKDDSEPPYLIEPVHEIHASGNLEDYAKPAKGYDTAPLGEVREENQSRSMRMAAKGIIIGLAAIAIVALYLVYSAGSPQPVTEAPIPQEMLVAQAPVFIPTPEEARNYSEEPEAPQNESAEKEDDKGDHAIKDDQSRSDEVVAVRKPLPVQPVAREAVPVTKSEVRAPHAVETGPVIPQSTEGRISSRLVRTRSNRIGSGVRYDLTFALEEQTGRIVKWDRMLISTRSARGVNQSQTLPFYHRQGASGSLTFTVSVEMKGGSVEDWRGRVICTTLGTDERGRTMQARFGATVAP